MQKAQRQLEQERQELERVRLEGITQLEEEKERLRAELATLVAQHSEERTRWVDEAEQRIRQEVESAREEERRQHADAMRVAQVLQRTSSRVIFFFFNHVVIGEAAYGCVIYLWQSDMQQQLEALRTEKAAQEDAVQQSLSAQLETV